MTRAHVATRQCHKRNGNSPGVCSSFKLLRQVNLDQKPCVCRAIHLLPVIHQGTTTNPPRYAPPCLPPPPVGLAPGPACPSSWPTAAASCRSAGWVGCGLIGVCGLGSWDARLWVRRSSRCHPTAALPPPLSPCVNKANAPSTTAGGWHCTTLLQLPTCNAHRVKTTTYPSARPERHPYTRPAPCPPWPPCHTPPPPAPPPAPPGRAPPPPTVGCGPAR